jgi:anti-sigma factor RsiW
MMNLEDKIMAYLDGTLDESARTALLRELSEDPTKRRVLEEHIKVREIISLGHKPRAVPLSTERKLAARVPVLMQELPYLAPQVARTAPSLFASTLTGVQRIAQTLSSRWAPAVGLGVLLLAAGITFVGQDESAQQLQAPTTSLSASGSSSPVTAPEGGYQEALPSVEHSGGTNSQPLASRTFDLENKQTARQTATAVENPTPGDQHRRSAASAFTHG